MKTFEAVNSEPRVSPRIALPAVEGHITLESLGSGADDGGFDSEDLLTRVTPKPGVNAVEPAAAEGPMARDSHVTPANGGGDGVEVRADHVARSGIDNDIIAAIVETRRRRAIPLALVQKIERTLCANARDLLAKSGADESLAENFVTSLMDDAFLIEGVPVAVHDILMESVMELGPSLTGLKKLVARYNRVLTKHGESLRVYPWVKSIKGFGAGNLAHIIAETGSLSNYDNPAKVWKMLRLHVENTGNRTGKGAIGGKTRAITYNLGECLIKGNEEYRAMYHARKAATSAGIREWTGPHCTMDAKRYIVKHAIKRLWQAWREAVAAVNSVGALLPPACSEDA